jgi:hypothetical protein
MLDETREGTEVGAQARARVRRLRRIQTITIVHATTNKTGTRIVTARVVIAKKSSITLNRGLAIPIVKMELLTRVTAARL